MTPTFTPPPPPCIFRGEVTSAALPRRPPQLRSHGVKVNLSSPATSYWNLRKLPCSFWVESSPWASGGCILNIRHCSISNWHTCQSHRKDKTRIDFLFSGQTDSSQLTAPTEAEPVPLRRWRANSRIASYQLKHRWFFSSDKQTFWMVQWITKIAKRLTGLIFTKYAFTSPTPPTCKYANFLSPYLQRIHISE